MNFQLMPHRPPSAAIAPLIRAMAAAGITPNMVSLVGFVGTGLAAGMKSIAKIGDRATGWMKRGAAAGLAAAG